MWGLFKSKEIQRKKERLLRLKEQETEHKLKRAAKSLNNALSQNKIFLQNFGHFNQEVAGFRKERSDIQQMQVELQKKEQQLSLQQQRLSEWEETLKGQAEENRREAISLHIKREAVKKDEKRTRQKDAALEKERESLAERQERARKAELEYVEKKDACEEKEKEAAEKEESYKEKLADLKEREKTCREKESDIAERSKKLSAEEKAHTKKTAAFESEYAERKESLEKEYGEIKASLEEKIKAYDLKTADLDSVHETMESLKADSSDDGKKAKIVVKEAIRSSIKLLQDMQDTFEKLNETYAEGTFKGFAVPLDEIDSSLELLKTQYGAIKEHAEATGVDFSLWLEKIQDSIVVADKALASYSFAECYRACVEGLSFCKGYSAMIEIFNTYAQDGGRGDEEGGDSFAEEGEEGDDWAYFYEVFFDESYDAETDYDSFDEKTFERQYRKLAKKYHPDHADEETRALYEEKMALINKIRTKIKNRFAEKKAA